MKNLGRLLLSASCAAILVLANWACSSPPDLMAQAMPYGMIGEREIAKLESTAKSLGVDLMADVKLAHAGDKAALGRVFQFSLKLSQLDQTARAYGQIIYSSFLTLGESMGVDAYARTIEALTPEAQQRVRDFIYYPVTLVPRPHQAQVAEDTRKSYPRVFPANYVFAKGNPIFEKGRSS